MVEITIFFDQFWSQKIVGKCVMNTRFCGWRCWWVQTSHLQIFVPLGIGFMGWLRTSEFREFRQPWALGWYRDTQKSMFGSRELQISYSVVNSMVFIFSISISGCFGISGGKPNNEQAHNIKPSHELSNWSVWGQVCYSCHPIVNRVSTSSAHRTWPSFCLPTRRNTPCCCRHGKPGPRLDVRLKCQPHFKFKLVISHATWYINYRNSWWRIWEIWSLWLRKGVPHQNGKFHGDNHFTIGLPSKHEVWEATWHSKPLILLGCPFLHKIDEVSWNQL